MLFPLSIAFGAMVGLALGLTGGGGSLLAVPLLVYGLSVAPREAFTISLAAVGAMALFGAISRIRSGQVELGTGVLFAVAGMIGAPLGTWAAGRIPETLLLTLFSLLMLVVASRMWNMSQPNDEETVSEADQTDVKGPACRRNPEGKLNLTSRCALLLMLVGATTGFLSGMFGVGGGFVIVPALVFFSKMSVHRAIATSLAVIVLISLSGFASHIAAGRAISLMITALFVVGGVLGMAVGGGIAKNLSAARLQKVFASGIIAVALFIASKTLLT